MLIIDDGGSDDTKEVIEKFSDNRIRYFYKENGERGAARNFGTQRASGKYITFFDSDDIVYPWFLSHAKENIEKLDFPECYSQAFEFRSRVPDIKPVFERNNETISTINKRLRIENILACNGVFLRKSILSEFSFSELRELSGSEDWFLWLQLSAVYPFYYSKKVCSCLINHDQRGELNIKSAKLIPRLKLLQQLVKADKYIMGQPNQYSKIVLASCSQFAALKMAGFTNLKFGSIINLFKAFYLNPLMIFHKTTYITLKQLCFSWNS